MLSNWDWCALLIVSSCVLSLIWGIDFIDLYLQHKDEKSNLLSSGKAFLLQFDILL